MDAFPLRLSPGKEIVPTSILFPFMFPYMASLIAIIGFFQTGGGEGGLLVSSKSIPSK